MGRGAGNSSVLCGQVRGLNHDITAELDALSDELSARLETCTVVVDKKELSNGYDDPQWNDRYLVDIKLRPEFIALINLDEELFKQENAVLDKIEKRSKEGLAWDDTGYTGHRGKDVYTTYLLDPKQLIAVSEALKAIPEVSSGTRQAVLEDYRND